MNKIAIIIPIHNGIEETKVFFNSFLDSYSIVKSSFSVDVIVIDDGSTDGSADWIEKYYPESIILKGDGNLWWGGAINLGFKYVLSSDYTHALLFNNDNILDKTYFENLLIAIDKFGRDVIIVSKDYNLFPKNKIRYAGGKVNLKKALLKSNYSDNVEIKEVDFAGGMGVLIPTSTIKQVGYIDVKRFPQIYGDTDFFLRARKNLIKIV